MVPLNPVEEAFYAFTDALRDYYPDGEGLELETQVKVLTYLAGIAQLLNIDIPEE